MFEVIRRETIRMNGMNMRKQTIVPAAAAVAKR